MNISTIRSTARRASLAAAFAGGVLLLPTPLPAQSVPGEIAGHNLPVPGEPVEGTTANLSEVEAELVAGLPPQGQAERLLQYAISHHVGATDDLKIRVKTWRGVITMTPVLGTLLDVARNGGDLRVRAAAIEIELAVFGIGTTAAQVESLLRQTAANPSDARQAIYILGLLANRGVETERIHDELRALTRSELEVVRYQAYAAIANIGTDETVADLVHAFHHDASSLVRIDAGGCGLAHCGMLTRAQRMIAVPGLIEMAADKNVGPRDRSYAFRALREITDETLPDNDRLWRDWYAAHGAALTEKFRRFGER